MNEHVPSSSTPDDERLDRAVAAMKSSAVPSGPSAMLKERTRQALRKQSASSPLAQRSWRWAAVIVLGATGIGTLVATRDKWLGTPGGSNIAKSEINGADPPANPPPLIGVVSLEGPPPIPSLLPPLGGPDCGHRHAPPRDESIVIGSGGGVANVVICIADGLPPERTFAPPAEPAVLDQKDCKYLPRVVSMQVGQSLVARNSDPFFHNVHTNPRRNRPVNVAQPQPDPVGIRLKKVAEPETFKVTCDLHPWMVAWVAAFDHPYNAVSSADGSFKMPPLEPGKYTICAWHERLGEVRQEIVVGPDWKVPPIQLKFTQRQLAQALADQNPTASAQ